MKWCRLKESDCFRASVCPHERRASVRNKPFVFISFLLVILGASSQSGCVGTTTSRGATPSATLPSITTQPASQTVTAGQTATFTVAATGTSPLSYQWNKNGTALSGATSSSYTTPATTSSDNGAQFTVTVSNSTGSVTSNAATLTVSATAVAPSITAPPASQTATEDATAAAT